MRIIVLTLLAAICIAAVGCSGPVNEVNAYIQEKHDVLTEMAKKVQADPSPAGWDAARMVFDARKQGLIAKRDAPGMDVKNIVKYGPLALKLSESDVQDTELFKTMFMTGTFSEDKEKKYYALLDDFKETVKRR